MIVETKNPEKFQKKQKVSFVHATWTAKHKKYGIL